MKDIARNSVANVTYILLISKLATLLAVRAEDEDEDVIARGHVHSRGGCHFDEQH